MGCVAHIWTRPSTAYTGRRTYQVTALFETDKLLGEAGKLQSRKKKERNQDEASSYHCKIRTWTFTTAVDKTLVTFDRSAPICDLNWPVELLALSFSVFCYSSSAAGDVFCYSSSAAGDVFC